jgi:hypothetical protein
VRDVAGTQVLGQGDQSGAVVRRVEVAERIWRRGEEVTDNDSHTAVAVLDEATDFAPLRCKASLGEERSSGQLAQLDADDVVPAHHQPLKVGRLTA